MLLQDTRRNDTVRILIKDTLISIAPDTATSRLLLECDSAGNVLLRELQQEQGKRITAEIRLNQLQKDKTSFSWAHENGQSVLEITCKEDSLQKVIERQCLEITKLSSTATQEPVRYIPDFYKYSTLALWLLVLAIFIKWAVRIARKLNGL